MTVAEIIEELKKFPPTMEVVLVIEACFDLTKKVSNIK